MTKRTDASAEKRLDAAAVRRLAVDASVDPRTIKKVLKGEAVVGLAGERARAALVKAGLLPSEDAK